MDTILLESPPVDDDLLHDHHRRHHHRHNHHYNSILKDSIDRFLHDSGDLSAFRSIFSRLIYSQPDPPLEVLWFYAAVAQPDNSTAASLDRVLSVRDLLQLLIACSSATHSSARSIALVAPVVAKLWHAAVEVMGGGKNTRKARKEVESLVEGLMGYISICGNGDFGFSDGGALLPCFRDVVRVWTATSPNRAGESEMEWLFPLAGDVIRAGFDSGKCGVEDLAGAVAAQTFLLRVMVRLEVVGGWSSTPETTSDLTAWAVGVLTGFGNFKSFGSNIDEAAARLKVAHFSSFARLIDLNAAMQSAKHEATLRQILYDSTLLVEYSFLSPLKDVESDDSLRHLALLRLFVFHEAIQLARRSGDHNKAIAYTNAFSRSHISSKLGQWMDNKSGVSNLTHASATTPQALIKRLLSLEKQGFRVLEEDFLRYREKLHFEEWNAATAEDRMVKACQVKMRDEELFFLDTKGEMANDEAEDAMELAGDAFLSAVQKMKSERSSNKKRKGEKVKGGKTETKYVKYKLHDDTIKDYFAAAPAKADVSSGSEVENPISDEDVDEMEE